MYEGIGKWTRPGIRNRIGRGLSRLPDGLLSPLTAAAGSLIYGAAGPLRRQVAAAMREVLEPAGFSKRQLRRFVRSYFRQLAAAMFELLYAEERLAPERKPDIRIGGAERLERVLAEGKGAIVFAPHTGNFFYTYWKLSQQYDSLAVVTAGSPELRPLYLAFGRLGCRGLDYDETPPLALMRRLKNHLAGGGVVFLLGDFYRESFPETVLFGRTTRLPAGAAVLALETGAPVLPCLGFRERGFRHRLELEEPLRLHERYSRGERTEAMAELGRVLERLILRVPDQWFYWFHAGERWASPPQASDDTAVLRKITG